MQKLSGLILELILIIFILGCVGSGGGDDGRSGRSGRNGRNGRSEGNLEWKHYKKRRWCPNEKKYRYFEGLDFSGLEGLKNYYRVGYDGEGVVIWEGGLKEAGYRVGHWYHYNSFGELIGEEVYGKDGEKSEEVIYEWEEGVKRRRTHYIFEGGVKFLRVQTKYYYNESKVEEGGRILARVDDYHTGVLDESMVLGYDEEEVLRTKKLYGFNNRLKSHHFYHYNGEGWMVREEIYNSKGGKTSEILKRYDREGWLAEEVELERVGVRLLKKSRLVYGYDKEGRVVRKVRFGVINEGLEFDLMMREEYGYDEKGCWEARRKYDHEGNLVFKKRF